MQKSLLIPISIPTEMLEECRRFCACFWCRVLALISPSYACTGVNQGVLTKNDNATLSVKSKCRSVVSVTILLEKNKVL